MRARWRYDGLACRGSLFHELPMMTPAVKTSELRLLAGVSGSQKLPQAYRLWKRAGAGAGFPLGDVHALH